MWIDSQDMECSGHSELTVLQLPSFVVVVVLLPFPLKHILISHPSFRHLKVYIFSDTPLLLDKAKTLLCDSVNCLSKHM